MKTIFQAVNGEAPYTYSLLPNDMGGVIDPVTGAYTAPDEIPLNIKKQVDTIRAVDSLGEVIETDILIGGPLEVVASIIRDWMKLSDDQVYIYNQKLLIPKDERLYVAIGFLSQKTISSSQKHVSNDDGLFEVSSSVEFATVSIDVTSRGLTALYQKEKIIKALRSDMSERIQTMNNIQISRLPSNFVNLSQLEMTAIPYRFNISINVQYSITNKNVVEFFDKEQETGIIVDQ